MQWKILRSKALWLLLPNIKLRWNAINRNKKQTNNENNIQSINVITKIKTLQGYTLLWRESVLASKLARLPVSHNFRGCKRERCRVSGASYLRKWFSMAQVVNFYVIYAGNLHFTKLSGLWAAHNTVSVKHRCAPQYPRCCLSTSGILNKCGAQVMKLHYRHLSHRSRSSRTWI